MREGAKIGPVEAKPRGLHGETPGGPSFIGLYRRTARRDQHRRGDLDDLGGDLLNLNPLHTDRKPHRLRKRFDRCTTRSSTNKSVLHRGRRDLLNDQQRRARCLLDTGGDLGHLGHLGSTISSSTPAAYPP